MAMKLNEIREYFGMNLSQFKTEWLTLPEKDRDQIREGLDNGSLTY